MSNCDFSLGTRTRIRESILMNFGLLPHCQDIVLHGGLGGLLYASDLSLCQCVYQFLLADFKD